MGPLQVDAGALLVSGVGTALTLVVTWLVRRLTAKLDAAEELRKAEAEAQRARVEALEKSARASMRTMLIDAHERYVLRGEPVGYDVMRHLEDVYGSYHALGGNGTGTMLWEAIKGRMAEP